MEIRQIAFQPPPPQANGRIVGTIFRLFLDRFCTLEFLQDLKKCIECVNKARTGPKQHILKHLLVPQKPLNTHQYKAFSVQEGKFELWRGGIAISIWIAWFFYLGLPLWGRGTLNIGCYNLWTGQTLLGVIVNRLFQELASIVGIHRYCLLNLPWAATHIYMTRSSALLEAEEGRFQIKWQNIQSGYKKHINNLWGPTERTHCASLLHFLARFFLAGFFLVPPSSTAGFGLMCVLFSFMGFFLMLCNEVLVAGTL